MYQQIRQAFKKPNKEVLRERMTQWRNSESIVKVERPLNIAKARALGYKAKKGVIIVRVKLRRGGHKRPRPNKGRRSKRMHIRKTLSMNYREIAEQRAERKFKNLTALNSYKTGKDVMNYFFEVIMIDSQMPEIKSDKQLSFVVKAINKKRALRGLTSAGKKARGLRN